MKRLMVVVFAAALLLAGQGVFDVTHTSALQAAGASKVYDPGQPGPYAVGFTSYVLTDTNRSGGVDFPAGRPIPVSVWYPVDPSTITPSTPSAVYPLDPLYGLVEDAHSSDFEVYGIDPAYQEPPASGARPFPLVIFSPGWGAPVFAHNSIGTRLASHGFVVAVMFHYGDWWWEWEPFDHIALASWNRPRDVSFTLTDLLARNQTPGDVLYGAIRPEQIAASGWSLGGYASMALTGGDDNVCDFFAEDPFLLEWMGPPPPETCTPSVPDPRIKAIVPLDGSNQILKFAELVRVTVPAMGIGEEWEMLALDPDPAWASWQARQHAAFSGRPAYRVDVYNSIHQSFADVCEFGQVLGDLGIWDQAFVDLWLSWSCEGVIPSAEAHRLTTKYMIAFLKTELVREAGYQHILTPGYALTGEPNIEFFITEKRNPPAISEEWPDTFIYFMHQSGSAQAKAEKDPTATLPVHRALPKQ